MVWPMTHTARPLRISASVKDAACCQWPFARVEIGVIAAGDLRRMVLVALDRNLRAHHHRRNRAQIG